MAGSISKNSWVKNHDNFCQKISNRVNSNFWSPRNGAYRYQNDLTAGVKICQVTMDRTSRC